jgi:hypothetical protein
MKCANCDKDAFYIYQLGAQTQIFYCNTHLPKFLEQAKKAGLLKTTEALAAAVSDGLQNITTKPVEEPKVDETEDLKPVKKVTKKKAE